MANEHTLVLGASPNAQRYSNQAVRLLRGHGHPVTAVGLRASSIEDVPIVTTIPPGLAPHTVTFYLNAGNQAVWEEPVLSLRPARLIFNPGAENPPFARRAEALGIAVEEACTLVMLRTGQF